VIRVGLVGFSFIAENLDTPQENRSFQIGHACGDLGRQRERGFTAGRIANGSAVTAALGELGRRGNRRIAGVSCVHRTSGPIARHGPPPGAGGGHISRKLLDGGGAGNSPAGGLLGRAGAGMGALRSAAATLLAA